MHDTRQNTFFWVPESDFLEFPPDLTQIRLFTIQTIRFLTFYYPLHHYVQHTAIKLGIRYVSHFVPNSSIVQMTPWGGGGRPKHWGTPESPLSRGSVTPFLSPQKSPTLYPAGPSDHMGTVGICTQTLFINALTLFQSLGVNLAQKWIVPPLDLKIFQRACTLCCGSPSKNSTLFSHNQLRTIAQRRKPRKKNFSISAFSQNLILTFGLLSQFDQRRRPYNADKSFMKSSLNYQTYNLTLNV